MLPLANIFQPFIDAFEAVLKAYHGGIGSWGLSIIALTVTVRLILFPLTLKQFKSMRALQELAPEIKKLQEKYKDDKQRQQQEMMRFYQERKVNPFGSCLPLLAQMPVFISLFYMLRKDLKVDICGGADGQLEEYARQTGKAIVDIACSDVPGATGSERFLFIPDLTAGATGAVLVLLIVLYVGSQLLSTVLMASPTMDKTQRYMMMGLPFFFVFFIYTFPAGLLVYWITTNFWTLGQQQLVRRRYPLPDAGAAAPVPAMAAVGAGGSSSSRSGGEARGSAPPPPPRKKKKRSGRRR